ncbi:trypsin-like serine peptidase [Micromonospora sp. NPDC005806]|uniref:trypsin-like serine peptidase n=1 Tax=Micromonospora sp. NPDC005806 TaxID=3364234 RepID=UPI0036A3A5D0
MTQTTSLPNSGQPAMLSLAGSVRPDWARIDVIWERLALEHGSHLRRQSGLEPTRFLAEAFATALRLGVLRTFALRLAKDDLVAEGIEAFNDKIEALIGRSLFAQQAFVNGVFGGVDARLAGRGLLRACDYVCRIDIDELQVGTGVLIEPTLVATAAHVIWPLVARDADGSPSLAEDDSLRASDDSLHRLTLTFGDALDESPDGGTPSRPAGKVATLHPDWLYWGSPPTQLERATALFDVRDVDGITASDGPWDLAVIRLAQPLDLPGPPQLVREPPGGVFPVHVLHHPHGAQRQGQPLVWSIGKLDEQLGGVPPLRYLHDANTLGGSSGAPVFDQQWRIVAVHQAGPRVLQDAAQAAGLSPGDRNRAVPIRYWCERLERIGQPPPDDAPILTHLVNAVDLSPYPYPVIGRRRTQASLWWGMRANAPAVDRLLIVRGDPGTGKRFTKRLVREYVESQGGAVATLDLANALTDDAASFARRIAGAMSAQIPQARLDGLTTAPREVRHEVTPALRRTWEDLASRHAMWLVLEGFAGAALDVPQAVGDLVTSLVGRLDEYPLLRLVLVGWPGNPPLGMEASIEDLMPPTGADIAQHFLPPGDTLDWQLVDEADRLLAKAHADALFGYDAAHWVVARLAAELPHAIPVGEP